MSFRIRFIVHSAYTGHSIQQYQRQLAKWGFRKNPTRPGDWEFIGRRTEKRKRNDDKESEVHVCGVELRPEKIKKEKYREAYVSTMDIFASGKMENSDILAQFTSLIHSKLHRRIPQKGWLFAPRYHQGCALSGTPLFHGCDSLACYGPDRTKV